MPFEVMTSAWLCGGLRIMILFSGFGEPELRSAGLKRMMFKFITFGTFRFSRNRSRIMLYSTQIKKY
ncbi:hypothetical protein V473_10885 [Sphingobium cupriresistens LL01]|uniref:Uncharacterized protein n=1 Tax=Sphingobium cupriresistens LL01 TaxID=1420583 RepID=A0A0J7Y661_9SPHN|nr:hypothetical protein V473_10885 [Sphingobium cupriresistens LL01]